MNKNDQQRTYRVLIEANKLFIPGNDGVKRYLMELLHALQSYNLSSDPAIEIDLYVQGMEPFPLKKKKGLASFIQDSSALLENQINTIKNTPPIEVRLLQIKERFKKVLPNPIYNFGKSIYSFLPFRFALRLFGKFLSQKDLKEFKRKFAEYDLIHIPLPQNFHYVSDLENTFLITIHDLSHKHFPAFHTKDNTERTERGIQWLLDKRAKITTVSEATKKNIVHTYSISPKQITVVHGAYQKEQFFPIKNINRLKEVLKKYKLPDCPFFLSLSTLEPRKNLINMMKAFSAFSKDFPNTEVAFFVCGSRGWKMEDLQKMDVDAVKNIYFPGFIEEEDLPVLYSYALALCYVSHYEGFGLPPLEAMACSTTVIYGNNSAMPEVIADAGLATDPNDVEDIKKQMSRLFQDEKLRTSLEAKALKRAVLFSNKKMALNMLDLYQNILLR